MALDAEAGAVLDPAQRRLELLVGERLHAAAVVADHVVVVSSPGVDALEVGVVAAEVEPLDEAFLGQ